MSVEEKAMGMAEKGGIRFDIPAYISVIESIRNHL